MSIIGKKAPEFVAQAVINGNQIIDDYSLDQFLGKQEVVMFFYPKDFTFVCPTELIELQNNLDEFKARGVAVVGCSTDTPESHYTWLNTPISKGGIKGVTYPLIADVDKTISHNYGVLGGEWEYDEMGRLKFIGTPVAYRGTFLLDKQGIVRHQSVNDMALGRNIYELIRIIDMLHHVEQYGNVCPVNWQKGDESLQATPESIIHYLNKTSSTETHKCNGQCKCNHQTNNHCCMDM
jgi:peroxiredoxin (alkyl hydroperoxide reductase subunit C)